MKVLDLQCHNQHVFEGWFSSEEDFVSQRARSLLTCPVCGHAEVHKKPSAPRLNLGASRDQPATQSNTAVPTNDLAATQNSWLAMARHVLANTEDVGANFAQEARKIHYGEAQERAIRGQATSEETQSLRDEGIAVAALPLPEALKGRLH
jgi:hypothetical protein